MSRQTVSACQELHTEVVFASIHKMQKLNEAWDQIVGLQVDLAGSCLPLS